MNGPWEKYGGSTAVPTIAAGAPVAPVADAAVPAAPPDIAVAPVAPAVAAAAEAGPWQKYAQPAAAPISTATPAPLPVAAASAAPGPVAAPPQAAPAAAGAPASPAEPTSAIGEIGRQVGLTVRAGVKGALALPGIVSDAVTGPVNAGLDAVRGEGNGFRFQRVGAAAEQLMSGAGLPEPKNATERVVQDAASGMAAGGAAAGAGQLMTKLGTGPLSRAVGKMLEAGAGTQVVSGGTSGAASGVVREEGGGAVAQTVAGLAGGLAPSVLPFAGQAALRGIARGGEAGRQRVADNLQVFDEAAGTTPTLGQATQGRWQQAAESGLSRTPGSAGVIARKAQQQLDAFGSRVQKVSDELAPGASAVNAGEAITRGVNAFKTNMKATQARLYSNLDRYIQQDTPIGVTRTQQALASLNEDIPGAPNLSAFFKNAKIGAIDRALLADLDAAARTAAGAEGAKLPGQLPYEAIKKLRTLVGNEIAENSLIADVPRSKWRALYGALSDDLGDAAAQAGPRATQAWSRANQYTAKSLERLEQLSSVVDRDAPEKVFRAATAGTAEGNTIAQRVMKSLPIEGRRQVAAAVLQKMGRARNGQQNELGDAFSGETFLTNLAALSPAARKTIFGGAGIPGLDQRITNMGRMASISREGGRVFANPSGTAGATGQMANIGALVAGLATGNAPVVAGSIAAPAGANMLARVAANPRTVRFAAERTQLAEGGAPAAVAATGAGVQAGVNPDPERVLSNRLQAAREARRAGGMVVPVQGGFAVRPAPAQAPASAAPAAAAPPQRARAQVDAAAREAATSPDNDRPEPTKAQLAAGNYKMGHTRVAGLDVTIEHPAGSTRRGTAADGTEWSRDMKSHYGYIKRTEGADGDQVDVYVGPKPDAPRVFVVDQLDRNGRFDEHKALLGYPNRLAARAAYASHYPAGFKVGEITAMPADEFKTWVKSGDLKRPLASARG